MANIIIKNYEHYNRSMGKYITSKAHYEREMREGGYMDSDKAKALAEANKGHGRKEYELSDKARAVISCAKDSADSKGNIKPSDKLIEGMKDVGCNFSHMLPSHYSTDKGGFDSDK